MTSYLTSNIKKEIGKKIEKRRRGLNPTQIEVSVEAGINSSYYSKIERGEVNPSLEVFFKIVKALKVKSSEILPF